MNKDIRTVYTKILGGNDLSKIRKLSASGMHAIHLYHPSGSHGGAPVYDPKVKNPKCQPLYEGITIILRPI